MNYRQVQIYFFLALLTGTIILSSFLFLPYTAALVLGGTLGVVFHPLYRRIARVLSPSFASLATIAIVLVIVLLPLVLFSVAVFAEARAVYLDLSYANGSEFFGWVERTANRVLPGAFSVNVELYVRQLTGIIVDHMGSIFSGFASIVVAGFIGLFALYYFLKDGERLKRALISLSPLADTYDEQIFRKLAVAVNSVIRGSILVALIQGILTGLGLFIFGVPNAALWGGVAVVASLVPAIGTAAIIVPAAIYLFVSGSMIAFIGFLIWGFALVGTIDNFLRPKLIERGIRIHPFIILLSVLGGLALFGATGFLLGPLLISLLFALLDIYKEEFKDYIQQGI
ncbi:MAG: AI-2E family transporter [Candidatus Liptonbacteria bacterium]|nr:AI-2E family transporter [Candidatus Liptonbacteria bacterium]